MASSSVYEIFHINPPYFEQCPRLSSSNDTLASNSSFFIPFQQPFIPCQLHNISSNETIDLTSNYSNRVQLVDSNYLMRAPTHFDCYILLFFARWCPFSVRFAPYFNALPRTYPGLDFVAYDVSKSLRYMTYFGTNAVPSVFILRKNKLLARLNSTNDIQILASLISSTLHLNQTSNVTVEEEDRFGPVTTTFEPSFDYALLFSWLFVGLFLYYYAEKYHLLTPIRQRLSTLVKRT